MIKDDFFYQLSTSKIVVVMGSEVYTLKYERQSYDYQDGRDKRVHIQKLQTDKSFQVSESKAKGKLPSEDSGIDFKWVTFDEAIDFVWEKYEEAQEKNKTFVMF